ncbi:MAG: NlpC/P60 family protein [Thermomicrobiales bacterium]
MRYNGSLCGRKLRMLVPAIGLLLVPAVTPLTASADTDLVLGGEAVISYANGDQVRLRSLPSYDGETLGMFDEGTSVYVIDGPIAADDGSLWYHVAAGDSEGYIVADWLALSGAPLYQEITGTAWTNDDVNLRSGPSLADDSLAYLAAGTQVSLTGQTMDNWLSVEVDGTAGWIYAEFLGQDGGTASTPSESTDTSESAQEESAVDWSGPTGTWHTNDSVNLRTDPSLSSGVVTVLPASAAANLTGAVQNGFAQASTDYGDGWIAQEYLSEGAPESAPSAAESQPVPETPEASTPEASAPASGEGQALVDYAMQFLGQAYVWAGNQPGGFDCSGLTQYVVQNVLGYDIGHGTAGQTAFGSPVDYGEWQAGDLIFFQNTGDAGISHVGIYIGNGQMIHAENPSTGVTISDVYSDYYTSHYYGAYRLV